MWWLVYDEDGKRIVWIDEGPDLLHARFRASLGGQHPSAFTGGHQLDGKTARKVPDTFMRRRLSAAEAVQLLKAIS